MAYQTKNNQHEAVRKDQLLNYLTRQRRITTRRFIFRRTFFRQTVNITEYAVNKPQFRTDNV